MDRAVANLSFKISCSCDKPHGKEWFWRFISSINRNRNGNMRSQQRFEAFYSFYSSPICVSLSRSRIVRIFPCAHPRSGCALKGAFMCTQAKGMGTHGPGNYLRPTEQNRTEITHTIAGARTKKKMLRQMGIRYNSSFPLRLQLHACVTCNCTSAKCN